MANELPIRFDNTFPKNLDPKLLDTILTFRPGVNKNGALSIKDLKAFLNSAGTFSTTFKAGPVGEYALIWESELGINQTYMFQLWYLGFTSDYFDANGQRPLIGRLDVAFAAKPTLAELDPNRVVITHMDNHGEDGDFVLQDEGGVAKLYVKKTAWNQRTQFNYIGALNTTDQENLVNGGTYGALPGGAAVSFESLVFAGGGSSQEGNFIRYDAVQQTSEEQKRNAATNVGAVKKFENDTKEGNLSFNEGNVVISESVSANGGRSPISGYDVEERKKFQVRVDNVHTGLGNELASLFVEGLGTGTRTVATFSNGLGEWIFSMLSSGLTEFKGRIIHPDALNNNESATLGQVLALIGGGGGGSFDEKVDKTSIVDHLTSVEATTVLSGNQGRILKEYIDAINGILSSDETTLDELQEIVNYIQLNREDLDTLSIPSIAGLQDALDAKLAITSVVDGLTSILTDAPLSANQGRVLKELIDTINNRLTSNEPSLNTLQEIVDLIKGHEETLLNLGIADVSGLQGALNNKVNVGSIVDHLTSPIANAPLSANQGRVLKDLIDAIGVVLSSDDPALDSIQKIVDRIKENGTDLSELQDSITDLNVSIASIESSIGDIEFAILDTQSDVTTIQGEVNTLETDVSEIKTDVSSIETNVSGLQSDIDNLESDVSGIETSVSGLQSSKVNISSIVDDLTSTLANVPLSANQGRVLKGLIDNINTILASDDTDLDEFQELVNFIKQNKEDLDTLSIPNIAGLVDALAEKVSGIGTENYLAKFDSTGKILGSSSIYDTGGRIGIGTSTPSSTITVGEPEAGQLSGANLERAVTNYQNGGAYFMGRDKDQGLEFLMGTSNSGYAMVACMTNHPLILRVGTTNYLALKIYPGGNIAIGHSLGEPSNKLDIDGDIRIRSISNATGEVVTVSPEGVITKRTLAELFNDLGITGPVVRDLIKNLVGDAKLDISDLKGQSVLDDTQYEVVDGKHTIKTDPVPTEDSEAFVTSGTVHTALQGTGVPNSVARQIPGYAPVFTKVSSPDSNSYREVIGLNGIVIASISNGDSDRIARSEDGINFYKVNVGFIDLWGVESSPHGTLIGVGRNAGPDNIIRSTDHGRTWNTITAPITRSLNRVIYHRGVWMCCARDGVGNRALYSTDDGLTWNSATTSEDNPYNDIVAKNGIVLLIGESGTNRIQRSTDLGQTYSNVTGFPSRFYTRGRVFKNKFVVMQSGAGSTDKLIVSDDGLTFTSAFPPPDSVVQFYGMEVIGDYLFIVGKGGAMYKTKDLSTFEAVDSGTTNDIYGICLTMINGFPVINTVSASGASDRITTSINLI